MSWQTSEDFKLGLYPQPAAETVLICKVTGGYPSMKVLKKKHVRTNRRMAHVTQDPITSKRVRRVGSVKGMIVLTSIGTIIFWVSLQPMLILSIREGTSRLPTTGKLPETGKLPVPGIGGGRTHSLWPCPLVVQPRRPWLPTLSCSVMGIDADGAGVGWIHWMMWHLG